MNSEQTRASCFNPHKQPISPSSLIDNQVGCESQFEMVMDSDHVLNTFTTNRNLTVNDRLRLVYSLSEWPC